jgi:DNA-binding NarL/FixJ family response regulator
VGAETGPGTQTDTPTPRRVLIADDHVLIRDGFKRMLGYEKDFEVVGEASDGRQAVELCRRLKPDLVLMDVRMPEMDGLESTRVIKAQQAEVSVLIITTYENENYLLEAIKAGAAGYVLKDASSETLVNSMRRVLAGESPLNQELAARLIQLLAEDTERPSPPVQPAGARGTRPADAAPPPLGDLSPRELEVLALVAQGKTNPQIAQELGITGGTAKIHVEHIIGKLGVSDRTQAVVRAFQLGLLDL